MPSQIKVDQIAGATGSTVTLPSGQTLDLSSGTVNLPSTALNALNATNLTSGTVPSARLSLTSSDLPTVPTTKGGTGLTTIGTASQVLRVNSGATALEFGTLNIGANAGEVIQVLSTAITSNQSTTSTSFVALSGLSVSITPSATANKVLILACVEVDPQFNVGVTLYRGATNLGGSNGFFYGGYNDNLQASPSFLDSPNTTSPTTYAVYWRVDGGTANFYGSNQTATITVMEIKG